MSLLDALPPWAAVLVGVLALLGAGFACVGSLGLLRLRDFYQRVHAPTLGSTLGTFLMVMANVVAFSVAAGRPMLHVLLIGVFLTLTTPITLMLLVRAALYRNRVEDGQALPPSSLPGQQDQEAGRPGRLRS